ncbi:MAG: hypothetical protein A2W53_03310 [Nitrospinae bacterium RIFCSPHIGHO2_02_39_11]|nr:MAG: hypothetical protein A2W53_03310 [Nitrospinae bacterium RIFCSPHIGHO2_02_39_11]
MPQELNLDVIVDAIWLEIEEQKKDIQLTISERKREDKLWRLKFEKLSGKESKFNESLEGAYAEWSDPQKGMAEVLTVFPSDDEIILRFATSIPPDKNQKIIIHPQCFLKPLKEAWEDSGWFNEIQQSYNNLLNFSEKPIHSECFSKINSINRLNWLREGQKKCFNLLRYPFGFLWGPPGTGKTTTLGVILAEYLLAFPECKILLISSTNVAVDVAIKSVDEALEMVEKDISEASFIRRNYIKRIGTHFRPEYYKERKHLLPDSDETLIEELIRLKSNEPDKEDIQAYAKWKKAKETLEKFLCQNIHKVISSSRLCAMTSTRAAFALDLLREFQPLDLIVFDEASQMGQAHALAFCPMARKVLFAGDPKQLSPIVHSKHPDTKIWLGESMFKYMKKSSDSTVMLTEQSRMIELICKVVSNIFYDGELIVAKKEVSDPDWIRKRSFPQLPEIKGVHLYAIEEAIRGWEYGSPSRYKSAEETVQIVNALLEKGINGKEIAVLTPFRAQRRLIAKKIKDRVIRDVLVSTVHRVQGEEKSIVIFDPVDGSSNFLNGENGERLINVAISRAKACLIILLSEGDKGNEIFKRITYMQELAKGEVKPIKYQDIVLNPTDSIGKIIKFPNCVAKLISVTEGEKTKIIGVDVESGKECKFDLNILIGLSKTEKKETEQKDINRIKPKNIDMIENKIQNKSSYEEFAKTIITAYREPGHKGIHSSVFNESFKSCFKDENPIEVTRNLEKEGKIVIRPSKGGVMLYLPEDTPAERISAVEVLKKMGL